MCSHVVCAPNTSKLILASKVPNLKSNVPMCHLLDIATDRRVRLNHIAKMKSVEHCCFAGIIEADHHDLVFPGSEKPLPYGREHYAHPDATVEARLDLSC
eukprot:CAMPEP_0119334952 /NCGR_PEP_ID=MMETSP1333-20130426/88404_1 /TAXON_ID=418940 /ORGANISM="Scyphosphaera apsteinii, Strain RCC1455" /LENGTH=99 /DNA_ID=CAMNT_0007345385 /DNA_START=651 /DNA_END=947 /DNA_ORIENTATION=-